MNEVAQNVYGRVEKLIDLNFAKAYAVVKTDSKNNHQRKADRTVIYKQSDVIVNKNGTFRFSKYHKFDKGEEKIPDVPWYVYLNDSFFRMVEKGENHFTEINFDGYDLTDKLAMFEIDKPKIENLVYPDFSSHLFMRYKDDYPLSPLYIFDYISTFNNMDLRLDEAFEHMKKHPYVKSVEKIKIPHYNVDPGKDEGLSMKLQLPQEEHDKLWKKCLKEDYPSCRIKDWIQSQTWLDKSIDPLGIRQFQRTKEEQEERRKEHDTEDNY